MHHSFTSGFANASVPPELRMKLTGRSSEAVHRGYTHHELDVLKSAVSKLPGLNCAPDKNAIHTPQPSTIQVS